MSMNVYKHTSQNNAVHHHVISDAICKEEFSSISTSSFPKIEDVDHSTNCYKSLSMDLKFV